MKFGKLFVFSMPDLLIIKCIRYLSSLATVAKELIYHSNHCLELGLRSRASGTLVIVGMPHLLITLLIECLKNLATVAKQFVYHSNHCLEMSQKLEI